MAVSMVGICFHSARPGKRSFQASKLLLTCWLVDRIDRAVAGAKWSQNILWCFSIVNGKEMQYWMSTAMSREALIFDNKWCYKSVIVLCALMGVYGPGLYRWTWVCTKKVHEALIVNRLLEVLFKGCGLFFLRIRLLLVVGDFNRRYGYTSDSLRRFLIWVCRIGFFCCRCIRCWRGVVCRVIIRWWRGIEEWKKNVKIVHYEGFEINIHAFRDPEWIHERRVRRSPPIKFLE